MNIWQQIKSNAVALISLVVALSGLGYNTWRNELTEANRNIRNSGFEILLTLGELEQVVFFRHYDRDQDKGNPREGWSRVLLLRDLSHLMPAEVGTAADQLFDQWQAGWESLGTESARIEEISGAIDQMRGETLEALDGLK